MITIKLSNSGKIEGATFEQITAIHTGLTIKNQKYVDAKKRGRYFKHLEPFLHFGEDAEDGYHFPRGYLANVLSIIGNDHKITIVDNRRTLEPVNFVFNAKLREYQEDAVRDVLKYDEGVLVASPGAGKTVMACKMIADRKQPVLIATHSKELCLQWVDRIRKFLSIEPGMIGAGIYNVKGITVGIVNTIAKNLDTLPGKYGFLIVDECHRQGSKTFTDITSVFDCKYLLGLTATPFRNDGLDNLIHYFLGPQCHEIDKNLLQENGNILTPEIIQKETTFEYDYQDNYSAMITVMVEDENRNHQIADAVIKYQSRGCVIVTSDRIGQLKNLESILSSKGIEPALLTGQMKAEPRKAVVDGIRKGKINVVMVTAQLIAEGFDAATLTVLILATPISFSGKLQQIAGRVCRPLPGKKALIVDFADNQVGVLKAGAAKRLRILNSL